MRETTGIFSSVRFRVGFNDISELSLLDETLLRTCAQGVGTLLEEVTRKGRMSEKENMLVAAARLGWARPMTATIARVAGLSESTVRAFFRDGSEAVSTEARRRLMAALRVDGRYGEAGSA